MKHFKPDFVKVVSTARSLADNLAVLRLIEDRSLSSHVVGIAMGEEGLLSRVLGPKGGRSVYFCLSWRRCGDGAGPGDGAHPARSVSAGAA